MLPVLGLVTVSVRRTRIAIAALLLGGVSMPGQLLAHDATGSITSINLRSGIVTVSATVSEPTLVEFLVADQALRAQLHVGAQVTVDYRRGTGQLGGKTFRITRLLTHARANTKPKAIQRCRIYAAFYLNVPLPTGPNPARWACTAQSVAAPSEYLCRCIPTFSA